MIQLQNKVQMFFTSPTTFKIHGRSLSTEDANLILEYLNEAPVFNSNSLLFERLCSVIERHDEEDIELALGLISDPSEREWFKCYLIDTYLGNDTSQY